MSQGALYTKNGKKLLYAGVEKGTLMLPKKTTQIAANTFDSCYELERVVLPKKLTTLEKETFRNCYSLRKIDLPKSLYKKALKGKMEYRELEY